MKEKTDLSVPKYFAAANSYRGFISYFDRIFQSKDFDRIFVLKGGPGTGKSSFMKKISTHFQEFGCYVEEIYCSSDPHSLDGVILSKNGRRVALLDGTAPHERDAVIPGAIDELINLGDGWDDRTLSARKGEILSLAAEKAKCYKTAYFYLSAAGKSKEIINHFYNINFDKYKAKIRAESILNDFSSSENPKISTRLVSSFGRYGAYRLDTINLLSDKLIEIGGSEESAEIFMKIIYEKLVEKGINMTQFKAVLSPDDTDAILIDQDKTAIARNEDGEICADEFLNLSPADQERIRTAKRTHVELLNEARRWFAIASDMHFRLEEIYGEAMDFERNNRLITENINKIQIILENM